MQVPPIVEALVSTVIGFALSFYGYFQIRKAYKLNKQGVVVEGVIFDFDTPPNTVTNDDDGIYPIIRFVTKEGLWITKKYHMSASYSTIKEGQKVQIIYDPNNPEEFMINWGVFKWIPYFFLIAGLFPLAIGVSRLVQLVEEANK